MNWLIITLESKKTEAEEIKELLVSHDATVFTFSLDKDSSKELFQMTLECDYCIWIGETVPSCQNSFPSSVYAAGYLIGKQIPFFCVRSQGCDDDFPLATQECHAYCSIEQLRLDLENRFPEFLEREKQKYARNALLEAGIPFNPDSFAFHIAANNEDECNLFIDAGIDVNSRDAAGTPMLCNAARHNRKAMIERLLQLGADIDAVSKDRGYSPVMDAVWKSNFEIVEYLVNKGANLSYISRDGQPLLVLAVGTGNEKICRILVEHGADPMLCDSMGMSALAYAKLFKKTSLIPLFEACQK